VQVPRSVHIVVGIENVPSSTTITQVSNATLAANLVRLKATSLFPVQLEASRLLKPGNDIDLTAKVLNAMDKTDAAAVPILS
jgi:hypothetical protein